MGNSDCMIECPSCHTVHKGRPSYCENCGYSFGFASSSPPITANIKKCPDCAEEVRGEARKCRFCGFVFLELRNVSPPSAVGRAPSGFSAQRLTRSQQWTLALFTVGVALLIAPSIREKLRPAHAPLPELVRRAEVGMITTVAGPFASWPCAAYTSNLPELMKLRNLAFDLRTPLAMNELAMTNFVDKLSLSRSITVKPGTRVKILLAQDDIRKICLIDAKGDYLWAGVGYQAEASRGCWVASDALTPIGKTESPKTVD